MADAVHNSYETHFRSPSGAVPCGETITLRLQIDRALPTARVELTYWSNAGEARLPMSECGTHGAWRDFEVAFPAPDAPQLLWYHFFVQTYGATFYVGNAPDGLGGVSRCYDASPPGYQITVFQRDFDVPKWLREGVMYQIFPDRFYDGKNGALLKKRKNIRVHADWYEPPDPIDEELPGEKIAIDFFGGNLKGIEKKLDYIASLGATVVYLNPVFRANSNHKYDVGDYSRIDPTFGTERDFRSLCKAAAKRGIRIVLDGVFSHTGEDSLYFNKYGRYGGVGAYQSKDSPFAAWYSFDEFPDKYRCWWGIDSLPEVNEMHPDFLDYIIRSDDAIIAKWLREGASGWRLDVADELPDEFIEMLRERVKRENPDACVIGEVWEDATNKVAYGKARRYALGGGLDSVMNYPLRTALIDFLRGSETASRIRRRILNQRENYPLPMYYSLMNVIGSHDRVRILNVLAGCDNPPIAKDDMAFYKTAPSEYQLGKERLKLMLACVVFLPGIPCVFSGDEAGVQGLADPFCRACYPWDREDTDLLVAFKSTLRLRRRRPVLQTGDLQVFSLDEDVLAIIRSIRGGADVFGSPSADGMAVLLVNRSNEKRRFFLEFPVEPPPLFALDGSRADCPGGVFSGVLEPRGLTMLFTEDGRTAT